MTKAKEWVEREIPQLNGKVAVITGANSGLGLELTSFLALKGARVVMACRSQEKADKAVSWVRGQVPNADIEVRLLDLADLSSIRAFARALLLDYDQLDILCNNAGVMALPYQKTLDSFEMQLGTNHLGHFALTCLLLEGLSQVSNSRVVNVSSLMHRFGTIQFDDLFGERNYSKWGAYGQSKLANLLFTNELARRLKAKGSNIIVASSHPGYSGTNLQVSSAKQSDSKMMEKLYLLGNRVLSQSAAMGTLPSIYACAALDVQSGDYFGPSGFFELKGFPKKVKAMAKAYDEESAKKLWELSEELTGVRSFLSAE